MVRGRCDIPVNLYTQSHQASHAGEITQATVEPTKSYSREGVSAGNNFSHISLSLASHQPTISRTINWDVHTNMLLTHRLTPIHMHTHTTFLHLLILCRCVRLHITFIWCYYWVPLCTMEFPAGFHMHGFHYQAEAVFEEGSMAHTHSSGNHMPAHKHTDVHTHTYMRTHTHSLSQNSIVLEQHSGADSCQAPQKSLFFYRVNIH